VRKKQTIRKTRAKPGRKPPTDKWIVGMIDGDQLKMFATPEVYTHYSTAVAAAECRYRTYGKTFVVFAKKCVIGPSRPPIMKQEYRA